MQALGQNIKTVRELKNLTQEYMAEQLHMSVSNYSNIENGKTNVTINRLEEIAHILKVDYQQILSLTPSQIFNNNGSSHYANSVGHQTNYINEELTKQILIKDEQIEKLTALLEKALGK